jgi:hypothetical protein
MKQTRIVDFLLKRWYVPIIVVGASVASVVTATTHSYQGMSMFDLWQKGDNPNLAIHQPLQAGGSVVKDGQLFNPSLEEFIAKKMSNNNTKGNLIVDSAEDADKAPNRISRELPEFNQMVDQQYFFKYSQHTKLIGDQADNMRKGTSGTGDIWVSTRIDKVYPIEKTKNTEAQCADVIFRITHFDVPRKTHLGGEDESVTFWQDFKRKVCQGRTI